MQLPEINDVTNRIAPTINSEEGHEEITVRAGEHGQARADTRVLQVVHKTFRLATTRMVDATKNMEPPALKPVIGPFWNFYSAVLHHHLGSSGIDQRIESNRLRRRLDAQQAVDAQVKPRLQPFLGLDQRNAQVGKPRLEPADRLL